MFLQISRGRKSILLDHFDQRALSRIVPNFCPKPSYEFPALDKIQAECKDMPDFPELSSSLGKRLLKLGFGYKRQNKKMQVYQRNGTVPQRQ